MFDRSLRIAAAALSGLLLVAAAGAAPRSVAGDVERLQGELQQLRHDVDLMKETAAIRWEAQDRRNGDAMAQEANHLSAISVQTGHVANYVAVTSAVITLILFVASGLTFFSATARATQEARESARTWFEQNNAGLSAQIDGLQRKVEEAYAEIARHMAAMKAKADQTGRDLDALYVPILAKGQPGSSARAASRAGDAIVEELAGLDPRPDAELTEDDYLKRGLADFAAERFDDALKAFDDGLRKIGDDRRSPETSARLLFAIGVTHNRLGQREKAIATFDEVERRFRDRPTDALRERVASALLNKGVILGNLDRPDQAIDVFDAVVARYGDGTAANPSGPMAEIVRRARNGAAFGRILWAKREWHDAARRAALLDAALDQLRPVVAAGGLGALNDIVLGNFGYALFLRDREAEATEVTRQSLEAGGPQRLNAQRADARRNRVEPQDTGYEQLLDRLWSDIDRGQTTVRRAPST